MAFCGKWKRDRKNCLRRRIKESLPSSVLRIFPRARIWGGTGCRLFVSGERGVQLPISQTSSERPSDGVGCSQARTTPKRCTTFESRNLRKQLRYYHFCPVIRPGILRLSEGALSSCQQVPRRPERQHISLSITTSQPLFSRHLSQAVMLLEKQLSCPRSGDDFGSHRVTWQVTTCLNYLCYASHQA